MPSQACLKAGRDVFASTAAFLCSRASSLPGEKLHKGGVAATQVGLRVSFPYGGLDNLECHWVCANQDFSSLAQCILTLAPTCVKHEKVSLGEE